ncbi:S-layer homology domain-containing protein [Cohnella sp. GCM10027633]|uniref:S-layer homology domain-containing protein n=1 Tax=unclassified Cohnella TaxID=2636738 RepID=UPI0036322E1E
MAADIKAVGDTYTLQYDNGGNGTVSISGTSWFVLSAIVGKAADEKLPIVLTEQRFTDTFEDHVYKAYNFGIVNGVSDSLFEPDRPIVRKEAVVMMANILTTLKVNGLTTDKAPYTDYAAIPSWAKSSANLTYHAKIFTGSNAGMEPDKPYTREQSIVTMRRLLNYAKDIKGISYRGKSIWDKIGDGLHAAADGVTGFMEGTTEAVIGTVEGLWTMVTHPIETVQGLVYVVQHPVQTAQGIWKAVSDSWTNEVVNGDADSRGRWFGRMIGEVALAAVGAKGVDKVAKLAKGTRIVQEAGGVRIIRGDAPVKAHAQPDSPKLPTKPVGDTLPRITPEEYLHPKLKTVGAGSENYRQISSGGLRNEMELTNAQRSEMVNYAKSLGFSEDNIVFRDGWNTGMMYDRLYINTDVLPAKSPGIGTLSANSRVSGKATIAHEIVGHYEAYINGKAYILYDVDPATLARNFALDEAQASIRAARYAPDLTSTERMTLLRDAITRLKNGGLRIRDVRDELFIQSR